VWKPFLTLAEHIMAHQALGVVPASDIYATGGSAPDVSGPEKIWFKDDVNPHIVYWKLNNGSGTAQWVQAGKGLP
jgi:hypothetical protein